MAMPYIPKVNFDSAASKDALPAGTTTRGVIVAIYHLGTTESEYEGKVSLRDTVFIEFELYKTKPDGTRFKIGREVGTYLGSANPKKGQKAFMRRLATACLGHEPDEKTFSPWELLGKSCQVQTGITSGGNMKIETLAPLSDEQAPLQPAGDLFAWSILDPNCRNSDSALPDFLLAKARSCRELSSSWAAGSASQPQPQSSAGNVPGWSPVAAGASAGVPDSEKCPF